MKSTHFGWKSWNPHLIDSGGLTKKKKDSGGLEPTLQVDLQLQGGVVFPGVQFSDDFLWIL